MIINELKMKTITMFINIVVIGLMSFLTITSCVQENAQTTVKIEEIPIGYKNLKLAGQLTKHIKTGTNLRDLEESGCVDWKFHRSSAKDILASMKLADAENLYAKCYFLPCWFEGTVKNEELEYRLIIGATSHITLDNEKETLHFILESNSNLFLLPCNCCE